MASKFNNFLDSFPTRAESYFEQTKVNQWINETWKTSAPYQTLSDIGEKTGFKKGANAIIGAMNAITVAHMNNTDPIFNFLMSASPEELCDFNLRNQSFRLRLMKMNLENRELTLDHIGGSISNNGDSQSISHEVMAPSYTTGNNYVEDYARRITSNQANGVEATRNVTIGKDYQDPYQKNTNLYPDQDGTGTFDNKWKLSGNKNSLLYKTKNLFLNKQINTIVDRFHTDPQSPDHPLNTKTQYGMSHGNNVLTRKAEYSNVSYPKNGYDNPYCRVWTHHHQYDEYTKVIRPFVNEEGVPVTVKQFHEWGKDWEYDNENKVYKGYYKSKDNTGWNYSVIGANGLPNITPKYISGGYSNIHTKQCMFSIENLAWRDYDPYSFETALSWEQRGPMGGRIMWFPPYGIQFNETVNTNWNTNQFIGRGEDIYTYTNTTRSGSLRFMLVVDHPSIVDYVGWNEANHDVVRTTDWRRFFAGCDTVDPDDDGGYGGGGSTGPNGSGGGKNYGPGFSIVSKAKPTPLTDEYIQYSDEKELKDILKNPPSEEKQVDEPKTVTFYVFYPNNYSGAYDKIGDNKINQAGSGKETNVDAIAYLLYGKGAQMSSDGSTDLPIDFEKESLKDNWGGGYEMKAKGLQKEGGYVRHSTHFWDTFSKDSRGNFEYDNIKYYYRVDYDYFNEYIDKGSKEGSPNRFINTCDQVFENSSYVDEESFGMNCDVREVAKLFTEEADKINGEDGLPENDNGDYLASLAEIAYFLTDNKDIKEKINENSSVLIDIDNNERQKKIYEVIKEGNKKIKSVTYYGWSNSHDVSSPYRKERNDELAKNRADTINVWLQKRLGENGITYEPGEDMAKKDSNVGYEGSKTVSKGVNKEDAKKYRSAKVVISFDTTSQNDLPNSNQEANLGEFNMISIIKEISDIVGFKTTCKNGDFASSEYIELDPRNLEDTSLIEEYYMKAISNAVQNCKGLIPGAQYQKEELKNRLVDLFYRLLSEDYSGENIYINKDSDCVEDENEDRDCANDECNAYYGLRNIFQDWVKDADAIELEKKVNEKVDKKGAEYNEFKYTDLLTELAESYEDIHMGKADSCYSIDTDKEDIETEKVKDKIRKAFNKDIKDIVDRYDYTKLGYPNDITKKIKNKSLDEVLVIFDRLFLEGFENCFDFKKEDRFYIMCPKNYFEITILNYDKDFENEINEKINKENEKRFSYFKVDELIRWASTTLDKIYEDKQFDKSNKFAVITAINESYNTLYESLADDENSTLNEYNDDIKNMIWTYITDYYNNKTTLDDRIYHYCRFKNVFEHYEKEIYDSQVFKFDGMTDKKFEDKIKQSLVEYNNSEYKGFSKHVDQNTKETYYINENENDPKKRAIQWVEVRDPESGEVIKIVQKTHEVARYDVTNQDPNIGKEFENTHNRASKNYYRYDQEYHFFKVLEQKSKFTYDKLMDKIKYFDPAFHSMTPEGFNARLTFLNQCMRQGNTVAATDLSNPNRSASNLAFGRPPYCVLRLGDFYNQLIVIDNISIDYDPLQWDLNTEGIGMQPLLANVNISFKFIGGGDMAGPVRRLQNAMSFNYYANASLYDNRADRMSYNFDDKTNGALDHGMKMENTYFHNVENYKKQY